MSKSVLISIKPKWCELIAIGKKTVEIRKTRPKIKPPFTCYIYETKGKTDTPWMDEDGHMIFRGRGQVIGEFVCDGIRELRGYIPDLVYAKYNACITSEEYKKYTGAGSPVYGWHISNLSIYDEPQEIGAFRNICERTYCFETCRYLLSGRCQNGIHSDDRYITRPPQSWMYVEEE